MANFNPIKLASNAINMVADYGEQALTAVGLKDKEPASYSCGENGQISHNVDLSDFPAELQQQANELIDQIAGDIEAKRQEVLDARAAGDTVREASLKADLDSLNASFTDVKFELEHFDPDLVTLGSLMGPLGVAGLGAEGGRLNGKLLDRFEDSLEAWDKVADITAGTTAEAVGTVSTDGEMPFEDIDSAVAMFENDPQAFFEKLSGMESEERGEWLMMIQQQIQQTNQLVTALTNFQKAQHDTQKAVLSNIRV